MIKHFSLGELCEIHSGGTPSRSNSEFYGGHIPWAKIADLDHSQGALLKTEECLSESGLKAIRNRLFPEGTLLFAIYGSMGKMAFAGTELATNQAILGITPKRKDSICLRYLYHFLNSKIRELQADGRGVTQKNLSANYLRNFEVQLPSYVEQQRVSAILDKADSVHRKSGQALKLTNSFLRSTFLSMFGDPAKNPYKWDSKKLGDLGEVKGGLQVTRERDTLTLRVPYLRVANVYRDRLDLSEVKEIGLTVNELERTKLQSGDVLIVEGHGNQDEIGRSSIWDGSIGPCVHQNHLIRFRASELRLLPIYTSHFLNSGNGRLQLIGAARTTSGLNTISTSKVKNVLIPVPPIELQKQYATVVEKLNSQQRFLAQAIQLSAELSRSISQRAFMGEL